MASIVQSQFAALSFSSSVSSASPVRRYNGTAFSTRMRRNRLPPVQSKIREIFMPALSSTMTEGKIVSWIKSEGEVLSKGESVVVVESDKADMDVETFYGGILAAVVVNEGETAPVGATIGILAESEEDMAEAKAKALSLESGSSAPPTAAAASTNSAPPIVEATTTPPPIAASASPEGPRRIVATPFAKKVAKQHKIDINKVQGTGPYGRITAGDVEKAAGIAPKKSASPAVAATPAPTASTAQTTPVSYPEIPGSTIVPFTAMQAAVSKNMIHSLSVPTFRVGYPIVTDSLDSLYEKVILDRTW
ncbi:unnamed protein product [Cuscuta europaea]|uniref:Dihydrolipoamide acetyltransferase component of pyruvate dehydrogenase complex n=1 Tax=Cuscuta europaea TaxID=41803 RepID=A0A9P1E687_CUSEU|nr:unnamed protein product [Cuscuta europaea]